MGAQYSFHYNIIIYLKYNQRIYMSTKFETLNIIDNKVVAS